jgi:hypothetical protein
MHSVMQGFRTIFDGVAIAYDVVSQDLSQEWKRKVRTLAGNWQLLSLEPELLLPWRNPCWWRFIAHKILRLIVPFALLLLLVSGAQLDGMLYKAATLLQLSFYGVALTGAVMPAARLNRLVNLCYFFLVMNVAVVAGFWRWITGQCATSWKPAYVKGADQ